ncbi:HAD-IIA family hydrolase [Corynebacterium mayonis]|uniref:HAD-IIA family hydrolase n=1 Tax=Corynebacterium mayonis TaxID=3062461 RepID=UPI00313FE290
MLLDVFDALLLDLDGTVWQGDRALPHTVEILNSTSLPVAYITNNASRAPSQVARMLNALGIQAQAQDVFTSALAAVGLARQRLDAGAKVLILGSESFKELARRAGFVVVDSADDNPVAVLQGHNPETGWRQLSEAALAIGRGAIYVASNSDTSLPSERGLLVGNGSMVAAVTSATGVVPDIAGKPKPVMFEQAAAQLKVDAPLAVGDRLDTDIAGAVAAKMSSLHVLTGVSGPWALLKAPVEHRPTFIGEDFSALKDNVDFLRPGPQGGFVAHVEDGALILDGGSDDATAVQALRTALEVVWSGAQPPRDVKAWSAPAQRALEQWW